MRCAWVAMAMVGCGSAPSPAPELSSHADSTQGTSTPEPVAAEPAPATSASSVASGVPSPSRDGYVHRLAAHLEPALGVDAPLQTWSMNEPPLRFDVAAYAHDSGRWLVTRGLGRVRQAWAVGTLPPRVELSALVDRPRPEALAVLRHLGRWLHGETEEESASRFGPYQVLRTDRVWRSVRFFALVPAGIFGAERLRPAVDTDEVTFLEVVPLGPEEYAQARMRGEGFVIAWWQRHRDPRSRVRRWRSAIEGI